jgi:RNA polymerase primary sigma factor
MTSRDRFFEGLFSKDAMRKRYPHYDYALQAYLRDIRDIPRLPAQQETELLQRAGRGDQQAKLRLVEANVKLVVVIAARFQGRGMSMIDLIAEGNIGLLEAIERFDFSKAKRLSTYAKFRVLQKISHALAERTRLIRTPTSAAQEMGHIGRVLSEFLSRGVEPTTQEIATHTGLPFERVVELLTLMQEPLSIDRPQGEDDPLVEALEAPPLLLSSEAATPSQLADVVQMMAQILTEPERQVLELRFGLLDGVTYDHTEIAEKLFNRRRGRVGERIRQLEHSALEKLRAAFDREEA